MTIGEKIRDRRQKKGLTQKQLGELCGIAEPNLRKYELGKQKPKLATLERIAKALDTPIVDLLDVDQKAMSDPDFQKNWPERWKLFDAARELNANEQYVMGKTDIKDTDKFLLKSILEEGLTYNTIEKSISSYPEEHQTIIRNTLFNLLNSLYFFITNVEYSPEGAKAKAPIMEAANVDYLLSQARIIEDTTKFYFALDIVANDVTSPVGTKSSDIDKAKEMLMHRHEYMNSIGAIIDRMIMNYLDDNNYSQSHLLENNK